MWNGIRSRATIGAAIVTFALVGPAAAHHRQTPPVTALTASGDNVLPRQPAFGINLALALPAATGSELLRLSILQLIRHQPGTTIIQQFGTSADPAIDNSGHLVAWDFTNDLGRQVYTAVGTVRLLPVHDPTGTSANPTTDALGTQMAFESKGDLAGTGNKGAQQIFYVPLLRGTAAGKVVQLSSGGGTSANASLDSPGHSVAFESTSDPNTGGDTGISQIWLADIAKIRLQGDIGGHPNITVTRITSAAGPSRNPQMSDDGKFIVFESAADLAGDGHDTGVAQIFAYHVPSGDFAQVTQEAGGCRQPAIRKVIGLDWHLTYLCGGTGYFNLVRANQRARLPIEIGDTNGVLPDFGLNFVVVSTTAACLNCGTKDAEFSTTMTTAGHQIYLLNLFKRNAVPVPGGLMWFPSAPF